MEANDLERLIDRELKQLPVPRAPETLLPRVLAAAAGLRRAPSHPAPWINWPRRWQLVPVAALALIAGGVSLLGFLAWPEIVAGLSRLGGLLGPVARVVAVAEAGATLVRACWHALLGPVTFSLLVVAFSLSLACAALWTALDRIAMGGASEP